MIDVWHLLYRTECLITGKFYIGVHSTVNIDDGYLGSGVILKSSLRKHGRSSHKRTILRICESREQVLDFEVQEVSMHLDDPLCMNIARGGLAGNFGVKFSAEHKAKIGTSNLGKIKPALSLEHRAAISSARKGVKHSIEVCLKRGEALKGKNMGALSVQHKSNIGVGTRKALADIHIREKISMKNSGAGNGMARSWVLISPAGVEYLVHDLVQFCLTQNLPYTTITSRGNRGDCTPSPKGKAKGWSVTRIEHELSNRDN